MSMGMSIGEMMVWAAAFVQASQKHSNDSNRFNKNGSWDEEYLDGLKCSDAEEACGAVLGMRRAGEKIADGYGGNSPVTGMLKTMIGENP
jgi:hypothetical protein